MGVGLLVVAGPIPLRTGKSYPVFCKGCSTGIFVSQSSLDAASKQINGATVGIDDVEPYCIKCALPFLEDKNNMIAPFTDQQKREILGE